MTSDSEWLRERVASIRRRWREDGRSDWHTETQRGHGLEQADRLASIADHLDAQAAELERLRATVARVREAIEGTRASDGLASNVVALRVLAALDGDEAAGGGWRR